MYASHHVQVINWVMVKRSSLYFCRPKRLQYLFYRSTTTFVEQQVACTKRMPNHCHPQSPFYITTHISESESGIRTPTTTLYQPVEMYAKGRPGICGEKKDEVEGEGGRLENVGREVEIVIKLPTCSQKFVLVCLTISIHVSMGTHTSSLDIYFSLDALYGKTMVIYLYKMKYITLHEHVQLFPVFPFSPFQLDP